MNPKANLLAKIVHKGGWVNSHAHIDRAYTLDETSFKSVYSPLKEKWGLVDKIKEESSVEDIYNRMERATNLMVMQGVVALGSFIDVDSIIEDKAIQAAEQIKSKFANVIKMKFINQTLKGVLDKEARYWFDKSLDFVDIIGGLPAKDKGREEEHLDVILSMGKKLNKRVHVHVDQFNTDEESETELLAKKVIKWGMEGKVTAIHSISVGAHPKKKREEIYKLMKEADLSVICCPVAWIDHPRTERLSPSHNSITPVEEMVQNGIVVSLGTDNINDIYKPFGDGDMWTEMKLLLEACKLYDVDVLSDIASANGFKVLGINI